MKPRDILGFLPTILFITAMWILTWKNIPIELGMIASMVAGGSLAWAIIRSTPEMVLESLLKEIKRTLDERIKKEKKGGEG